jgi:hypothetical protein
MICNGKPLPPPPRPQMNPAVSQLSLYDVANVKGVAADISHVNTKAKAAVSARRARRPPRPRSGRMRRLRSLQPRGRRPNCSRACYSAPARPSPRPPPRPNLPRPRPTAAPHHPPRPRRPARRQGFEGPDSLGDALKGCDLVIIPAGVPRKPGMTRDDLFKARPRGGGRLEEGQRGCRGAAAAAALAQGRQRAGGGAAARWRPARALSVTAPPLASPPRSTPAS